MYFSEIKKPVNYNYKSYGIGKTITIKVTYIVPYHVINGFRTKLCTFQQISGYIVLTSDGAKYFYPDPQVRKGTKN